MIKILDPILMFNAHHLTPKSKWKCSYVLVISDRTQPRVVKSTSNYEMNLERFINLEALFFYRFLSPNKIKIRSLTYTPWNRNTTLKLKVVIGHHSTSGKQDHEEDKPSDHHQNSSRSSSITVIMTHILAVLNVWIISAYASSNETNQATW
jgi:hypothetical protein